MVNMVLMIIFFVVAFGIFGYYLYKLISMVKNPSPGLINYASEIKKSYYYVLAIGVATLVGFIFLALFQQYPLTIWEWVWLVFGSFTFGASLSNGVFSFIYRYYMKEIDENIKQKMLYSILLSCFLIIIALWRLTDSFADYLVYPMVNGISFTHGFVNPSSGYSPNVTWYALCILSGALLVYVVTDHRYYKEYGVHGVLESTFFVAFPAGIIGARIGYVIGEWDHSFASRVAAGDWAAPFKIWEGGLTIISGAAIGIIVGVAWFLWRNKKYSIWLALDIVVPCILFAQAIGRWGNYFNCEVHGFEVSKEYWRFLPKIVLNNMAYSEASGWASEGNIYVPLFFIESVANLVGYFVIRYVIGKGLRKYLELGDLAAFYIAWYGLTRVIMEPLRDSHYNMGTDGYWSWIWSMIFVLAAAILLIANHIVRYIIEEKKGTGVTIKNSLRIGVISGACFFVVGLTLIVLGAVYMSIGTPESFIGFSDFNNGVIMLIVGLSVFLIQVISLPYVLRGMKAKKATV